MQVPGHVHTDMTALPAAPEAASRFIKFVNASPTPFHAINNAALRLESAGFRKVRLISTTDAFKLDSCRSEKRMIGRTKFNLAESTILLGLSLN